jgi:AcrR family transcriptional regulator
MRIGAREEAESSRRPPLSRERVVAAAVDLADREGIGSVSMRKLGQELGIEAMSLYTHVRGKEDLLDGMIEAVMAEIPIEPAGSEWRSSLRGLILTSRAILKRHPWAPPVIETRLVPGPTMIGYMDTVAGIIRRAGFSLDQTHHAMHALGSRVLGFNQELFDDQADPDADAAAAFPPEMIAAFPYVSELALGVSHEGGLGDCDDDVEFAFGLDLILDGLDRLRV